MAKKKHKTLAGYFGGFFEAGKKAHAPLTQAQGEESKEKATLDDDQLCELPVEIEDGYCDDGEPAHFMKKHRLEAAIPLMPTTVVVISISIIGGTNVVTMSSTSMVVVVLAMLAAVEVLSLSTLLPFPSILF